MSGRAFSGGDAATLALDALLVGGWEKRSFADLTAACIDMADVATSDRVNDAVCTAAAHWGSPRLEQTLRGLLLMHFRLGARARFVLSDLAATGTMMVLNAALELAGEGGAGTVAAKKPKDVDAARGRTLVALCVLLLSLDVASHPTLGGEARFCLEFLSSSPEKQRRLIPLVRRVLYALPAAAVATGGVAHMHEVVSHQALEPRFHPSVRVWALAFARGAILEEFLETQLLHADVVGVKPGILSAAPVAVRLVAALGIKDSRGEGSPGNGRRAAKVLGGDGTGDNGASSSPVRSRKDVNAAFTVLHFIEEMTPSQLHHCFLLAGVRYHVARVQRAQQRWSGVLFTRPSREGNSPTSPLAAAGVGAPPTAAAAASAAAAVAAAAAAPAAESPAVSRDACTVLATYVCELLWQLTAYCADCTKHALFSFGRHRGLRFVEGVAVEAIALAQTICQEHPDLAPPLIGEVTGFLYTALRVSRCDSHASPPRRDDSGAEEIPEFRSAEKTVHVEMSDTLPPHFGPELSLACLEFVIRCTPMEEAMNFFGDVFRDRVWSCYIRHHPRFAQQFCLLLLRNAPRIGPHVIAQLTPRIMWLLALAPHSLLGIVRRLMPFMCTPTTAVDLFLRIALLPLICHAAEAQTLAAPSNVGGGSPDFHSAFGGSGLDGADNGAHTAFMVELFRAIDDWSIAGYNDDEDLNATHGPSSGGGAASRGIRREPSSTSTSGGSPFASGASTMAGGGPKGPSSGGGLRRSFDAAPSMARHRGPASSSEAVGHAAPIFAFSAVSWSLTTALARFVDTHRFNYVEWDALHRHVSTLSPRMLACFRVAPPLLSAFFACSNLPSVVFRMLFFAWSFALSPLEGRAVLTDALQDAGRGVAERVPSLVVASLDDFHDAIVQVHIPERKRSWEMQRWAAVVAGEALHSDRSTQTAKQASAMFDTVHVIVWELVARASVQVATQLRTVVTTPSPQRTPGNNNNTRRSRSPNQTPLQGQLAGPIRSDLRTPGSPSDRSGDEGNSEFTPTFDDEGGPISNYNNNNEAYLSASGGGFSVATDDDDNEGLDDRGGFAFPEACPWFEASFGSAAFCDLAGGDFESGIFGCNAGNSHRRRPAASAFFAPDFEVPGTEQRSSQSSMLRIPFEGTRGNASGGSLSGLPAISTWRMRPLLKELQGAAFTEHMHSLVLAITRLAQRCPAVKERAIVCLLNVVRTLQKSEFVGDGLIAATTMCVKLLRLPPMEGVSTMPLAALLGQQQTAFYE